MSQGYQAIVPQRLFTSTGVPADGWLVYTYEAGTTTPLTTYSNGALTSANTNPIETSATGYFTCFVAQGTVLKFEVHDADDVLQFTLDNVEAMIDPTASSPAVVNVPAGAILPYGAATAPSGYLLCDGSLVSRATYSDLFAAIGTEYGTGDGSTTFGLPNLVGRFPLGVAASGTGSTLGGTGGAIDHTHTGPSHTHTTTVPRSGWGALAVVLSDVVGYLLTSGGGGGGGYVPTADQTITSSASGTGDTGTANPPYQTVTYIIKT